MAAATGMSRSTVSRSWRAFALAPHRSQTFGLSTDPLFIDKVRDVVGLYLDPQEKTLLLCVDEKSQIQALGRSQPVLPMVPGVSLHRRHRAVEFTKFLSELDKEVPARPHHPASRGTRGDRGRGGRLGARCHRRPPTDLILERGHSEASGDSRRGGFAAGDYR